VKVEKEIKMKNNLVRVSMLVLGAAAGYAQSVTALRANIPFDFMASGVNLPAGDYSVETKTPTVAILQARDKHASVIVGAVATQSLDPQKEGHLVFHRYGNQYFLADIWVRGSNVGRHIPVSKQERSFAKGQTEPGEVILAALR
jgi:hypothetical protein